MENRREPVFESEQRKTAPTLAEFAKNSQMTEDKVWDLIEEGQVSARFVNESILILQEIPTIALPTQPTIQNNEPAFAMEPNVPEFVTKPEAETPKKKASFPDKVYSYRASARDTDKLEDLDFAEDSSELLTFAQDALSRTAELSKELLATKNELIRLKDERIAFLSDLLQKRDSEIRTLNRNIEELVTLNNFETR